jgi:hypothetical protein
VPAYFCKLVFDAIAADVEQCYERTDIVLILHHLLCELNIALVVEVIGKAVLDRMDRRIKIFTGEDLLHHTVGADLEKADERTIGGIVPARALAILTYGFVHSFIGKRWVAVKGRAVPLV